jgi:dUTP pyrophosphatase
MTIPVLVLPHAEGLPLPARQTEGSAGMDLMAAIPEGEPLIIQPGAWLAVPTGLCLGLPAGLEAQVRPRSGLAFKEGVTVLNAPGTIDSDYRGEVKVILINHGKSAFRIKRGMRIAQMVIAKVEPAVLMRVDDLDETTRGAGGFGSTGHS